MNILACDNCGVQSPDMSGVHTANNWFDVTVNDRFRENVVRPRQQFLYCRDCMGYPNLAQTPYSNDGKTILQKIKSLFS